MATPMTPQQFATTVRAKHPGAYDDLSDADLTSKVIAKYPQYSDMVQSQNPVGMANQALAQQNPAMQVSGAEQNPWRQSFVNSPALNQPSGPHSSPANSPVAAGVLGAMNGTGDAVKGMATDMAQVPSSPLGPIKMAAGMVKGAIGLPKAAGEHIAASANAFMGSGPDNLGGPNPAKGVEEGLYGAGDTAQALALAKPIAAGVKGSGPILRTAATTAGDTLQSAGANLIDRTAGSLKADFRHGAEPGRGYLEGGGKPAWSMRGLASKAEAVKQTAGEGLGEAYKAADASGVSISPTAVRKAVTGPVDALERLQNAPGGTGASPQLAAYRDNLMPPIDAAGARGGFTPSELFSQVKKPMSANTRWNDPTMFDLNTVRQQGTGAVGGLLTDAVPETAPLNKIYQGSGNIADRANARADTGSAPLTQIGRRAFEGAIGAGIGYSTGNPLLGALPLLADTVPVKTAVGYGLFKTGKGLSKLGRAGAGTAEAEAQGLASRITAQPKALSPRTIDAQPVVTPESRQLPAKAGRANFGETEIKGSPAIPREPLALPQRASTQITPGRVSWRQSLRQRR